MYLSKVKGLLKKLLKLPLFNSFCFGSAIFGYFIGIVMGFQMKDFKEPNLVYVNMDKVIVAVAGEVASQGLKDDDATKKRIMSYREEFEKEIEGYSKNQGVVIFSSPKPIAGANDKTEYFVKKILGKVPKSNGKLGIVEKSNKNKK